MTDIHSCSLYCTNPPCIKQQRDELRDENATLKAELAAPKEQRPKENFTVVCQSDARSNLLLNVIGVYGDRSGYVITVQLPLYAAPGAKT